MKGVGKGLTLFSLKSAFPEISQEISVLLWIHFGRLRGKDRQYFEQCERKKERKERG